MVDTVGLATGCWRLDEAQETATRLRRDGMVVPSVSVSEKPAIAASSKLVYTMGAIGLF